jgi:hypothetical protein
MNKRLRTGLYGAFALAVVCQCANAQEAQAEKSAEAPYDMKQEQAPVGSLIRRTAATGPIPFDKPYRELTEEQKNSLKSVYENMGQEDEPPYPIKGIKRIMKAFSTIGEKLQAEGVVHMLVDVDSAGTATSVSVLKTPDPEIAQYMANVLMLEKYKPAICKGQPCAQQYNFEMKYTRGLD